VRVRGEIKVRNRIKIKENTIREVRTYPIVIMSLDLSLLSRIMNLPEGEVNAGDEEKVIQFEKRLEDWQRNVVDGKLNKMPTREDMASDLFILEDNFNG
jgi:hypothetical protein